MANDKDFSGGRATELFGKHGVTRVVAVIGTLYQRPVGLIPPHGGSAENQVVSARPLRRPAATRHHDQVRGN